MSVVIGAVMPHPPIVVPEVGGEQSERVRATAEAMLKVGEDIARSDADTLVLITPHGPVHRDAVTVLGYSPLAGDLGGFGAADVEVNFECDLGTTRTIVEEASDLGVPMVSIEASQARRTGLARGLDHGSVVPLHFLEMAGVRLPLVHITIGFLAYAELMKVGKAVDEAARVMRRRLAVVASGDLSHRLTRDAPAGYSPRGAELDRHIVEAFKGGDLESLFELDEDLIEDGGECGLRPIAILAGSTGRGRNSRVLSYEGPFGVGYLVAEVLPAVKGSAGESEPVALARKALEEFLKKGRTLTVQNPPESLRVKAGCFVTLHGPGGELRGCIGTTGPTAENLAEEIVQNAICAATRDPRFPPVAPRELGGLEISVDVLSPPEEVEGLKDLDPKRYGVIVSKGPRQGLLLPDLEGVDTVEEQVGIALRKAGLPPVLEGVRLQRFEVKRYH